MCTIPVAFVATSVPVWFGVFLWWIALDLLATATAYAWNAPPLLLKGSRMQLVHAPLLLVSYGLARAIVREERTQVSPGIWVGGVPSNVPADFRVVDVTAELPLMRKGHDVVPMLDGVAPSESALRQAAAAVVSQVRSGAPHVLVHCASGRGRSVCVAALALVELGREPTIEAALRTIGGARRQARLTSSQRRRLEAISRPAADGARSSS